MPFTQGPKSGESVYIEAVKACLAPFSQVRLWLVFFIAQYWLQWQEALILTIGFGVVTLVEGMGDLMKDLRDIRRAEKQRADARHWKNVYWRELTAEFPEDGRDAIEEITETRLYRWVEKYEVEIRRLPVAARQEIYEIAETRN